MRHISPLTIGLLTLAVAACTPAPNITSFEECVAAGNPVMESYPQQCSTPDGQHFVEDIGNELEKSDLIRITSPRPNATVSAGLLTVEGEARGYWYFEASFPLELKDAHGVSIAQSHAESQSDWMTEDFVPFQGEVMVPADVATATGTLILHKDNPSGLPENDDALLVPVRFGP